MPIREVARAGESLSKPETNRLSEEAQRHLKDGNEKPVVQPLQGEAAAMLDGFCLSDEPGQVQAKKDELEEKYGVKFDKKESLPAYEQDHFREPTLKELEVMDNVLNKSPELRREEVHLVFQNDNQNHALADHQETAPGVTRITVRHTDLNPVMDDAKEKRVSLGSVLLHELGHEADHVAPRDNESLGWKPAGKDENGQQDFALETTDGRLYKFIQADKDPNKKGYWQKVDGDGNALNDQADSHIPDADMQTMAKVRQPMHPASNPAETFANAVRMYRQDEKTRAELKEKSPEIYEYMEKYDRQQVRKLGTDFFGTADYQRDAQGNIVKNAQAWNPLLM